MMHVTIVGSSGAIAMNLTICRKQVDKQQVVVKTVHKQKKFSYLKTYLFEKCLKFLIWRIKEQNVLYSLNW